MQDKGVGIQRSGAVEIKLRGTNSKPGTKLVKRNTKGQLNGYCSVNRLIGKLYNKDLWKQG